MAKSRMQRLTLHTRVGVTAYLLEKVISYFHNVARENYFGGKKGEIVIVASHTSDHSISIRH